ncbi:hypothetical protein KO465_04090 [Candidatus Micrarchaeota archaeon]|nr:hypothetical protein [Candidatus Micrarchaeota archaeon]
MPSTTDPYQDKKLVRLDYPLDYTTYRTAFNKFNITMPVFVLGETNYGKEFEFACVNAEFIGENDICKIENKTVKIYARDSPLHGTEVGEGESFTYKGRTVTIEDIGVGLSNSPRNSDEDECVCVIIDGRVLVKVGSETYSLREGDRILDDLSFVIVGINNGI